MRSPRTPRILRALSAASLLALSLAPARADTTCKAGALLLGCKSTTTFSVYTGNPTVICLIGHPVVQIVSTARCQGHLAGPALFLRCGVETTPFSYSGGGWTHTFETLSNWETVLGGACDDLVYTPTQG